MNLESRIQAFAELGNQIKKLQGEELENLCLEAKRSNAWFTPQSIQSALKGLTVLLEESELKSWVSQYQIKDNPVSKKVGVVMAGNIPMVGFHDFLTVLITGNKVSVKLSSSDNVLPKKLADMLIAIDGNFRDKIEFVEKLSGVEAAIATGSDNSAKYFHLYFSKIPHIIRANRISCAVLRGDETEEDLYNLGLDILMYFGMGCRNVSKIYAPQGYDFQKLLYTVEKLHPMVDFNKYYNNYDYNKSIFAVNKTPYWDNNFLLLTESEAMASPVSVVYYEYYQSEAEVTLKLESKMEKIQTIVSKREWFPGSVDFGQAQYPTLSDYADGIDTIEFLLNMDK